MHSTHDFTEITHSSRITKVPLNNINIPINFFILINFVLAKTKKIYTFIENEKKNGVNKESTIVKMFNKLEIEKFKLESFFQKIKGNVVYGYGAPAKAVTLINYFNLNEENINLIIDDSKLKQNKYIPGSKIIITNSKILYSKPPKYIIILAWNIYKDILAKLKNFKNIGYIVIPLPKFRLIKL